MTVKSAAAWSGIVVCKDATGALAAPGVGPAGVLYVDGTANGAAVTVAGANPYKWNVTLPALTAGQTVSMYITATIGGIATASVVAEDTADTVLVSDVSAYVDTEVAAIKVVTDKLGTALELDGAVYRYTANALEEAPAATATVAISATTAASVASGAMGIRTFHTFSQAITSTSTAALNTATKVWLAIKSRTSDADSASQVFIEAAGGLTVLAGATYTTTAHGTLVVTGSSGAWVITLGLDEVATGLLTAGSYVAEVKALVAGSTVAVWDGDAVVSAGIVRTVA